MNQISRLSLYVVLTGAFAVLSLGIGPGSVQAQTPQLVGLWNSFLGQENIVECSNLLPVAQTAGLAVRDASGSTITSTAIRFAPGETRHIILSQLGVTSDRYGSLLLTDTAGSPPNELACHTMIYRFRVDPGTVAGLAVEYAFSTPFEFGRTDETSAIFNSFNPNGSGQANNWLTLINLSATDSALEVTLYDQQGVLRLAPVRYFLTPGERRDVHIALPDSTVGVARIRPVSNTPYLATTNRYFASANRIIGLPVPVSQGTCAPQTVSASTVESTDNWLEAANFGTNPLRVQVDYFSQIGAPLGSETVELPPRAQTHFYVNRWLGTNAVGSTRVSCNQALGKLHVQNLHYSRASTGSEVRWAYASVSTPKHENLNQRAYVPLNTFLGAYNWLKVASSGSRGAGIEYTMFNQDGSVARPLVYSIGRAASLDFPLHETLGQSRVGGVLVSAFDREQSFGAELLRAYPDASGQIQHITRIPTIPIHRTEPTITLIEVTRALEQPLGLATDGSARLFVVERTGRVKILRDDLVEALPFLDLRHRVSLSGEQGLLGLAFHPDYASNGYFFVFYSDAVGDSVISRFRVSSDPNSADTSSEVELLRIPQSTEMHKGGQLGFGPDGFLYIAIGDGEQAGGPAGNASRLDLLLGKLLRIDVNFGSAPHYRIPPSNPFVGAPSARPEIFAYGFRNPWRFAFDSSTGRLFAGDVGEGEREEIDLVLPGRDYGWNRTEGSLCFAPQQGCNRSGVEFPISEYTHQEGIAIIGGTVYRGSEHPELYGSYLFGDYASGKIWTLRERLPNSSAGESIWERSLVYQHGNGLYLTSLGEAANKRLYATDITGKLYRVSH